MYRLINGSSPSNGRVEVAYDGLWGTVCENGFDNKEASVLCRQLGFRSVFIAKSFYLFFALSDSNTIAVVVKLQIKRMILYKSVLWQCMRTC